ncbi:MAG: hypothetical protein Fur0010_02580 [Bdellovibrio sp.]
MNLSPETETIIKREYNLFGRNSKASGNFQFQSITHLSGDIEGEISMLDESPLIIESSAYIKGIIKGKNIEIFGKVEGSIHCSEKLTLHSSAIFSGEIHTANLVIRPGAVVNMDCQSEQNPS